MSASSNRMLDLLQQLSVLNELDNQSQSDSKSALLDSRDRRLARDQIRTEMKQLASSRPKNSKLR